MVVFCALSCAVDDTIHYNNVTMGNFSNGQFITDQGLTYNIVDQLCEGSTDTLKRALIACDVLGMTADNTYDIRLKAFESIFTKSPVDSTKVTDPDVFVENPLSIGEVWYAGGYLNMYIYIPMKKGSQQAHMINLVRDDKDAAEATYNFTLKHNAFGEVFTESDSDFIVGATYVSFPICNIIKEDAAKINLSWTSHAVENGLWTVQTQRNTTELEWTRGSFEHKIESVSGSGNVQQGLLWM